MIARTVLGKILVFSVFFIGIATGATLDTAYRTRVSSAANDQKRGEEPRLSPEERARRDRDRMAQYLGLDQSQQEQIAKIQQETGNEFRVLRDKTDPEFKALHDQIDPQFKAIADAGRARIRAVLNPEQQKKMDEFWSKRGNRNQNRPPRPGDRPEPGDRSEKSDRPNSNK